MISRALRLGLTLILLIPGNRGNISMGQVGTETIHLAGETGTLPDVQVQLTSEPINNPGTDLQTENLYQGPVTFSVVFGQSLDEYNEITPSSSPVKDSLNVERNGNTQSVPQSNRHSVRLFIHLAWPGIEKGDTHIQELSKKGRLSRVYLVGVAFKMSLEAGDSYFGEISHYFFDSIQGGWVRGNLPDGAQRIWVQPVRKANESAISEPPIEGKWEVALFDVTPRRGRILSKDCPVASCLPGDFLSQLNGQVKAEGNLPVLCPGQAANGVVIQRSWIETRSVWEDFTRQMGFEPALENPGQEWIMIAISMESSLPSFVIVFPKVSETYQPFSLAMTNLYGESSKIVTLDTAFPTLRSVQHGVVLQGLIPQGASLQQGFLVQTPYGPIWRLSCAGN